MNLTIKHIERGQKLMIQVINEELFNVASTREENENGEFFKTVFNTSFGVKNSKTGKVTQRAITTAVSPYEDPNCGNMSIHTTINKFGNPNVNLRTNDKNVTDTDVFLIAIPFNGFIQEIEKSFNYRIYRGFVVHSDKKNIEFDEKTYKKVAYMMVTINSKVFDKDHKYHTDDISLTVNTFNLETDATTQEKKTVKTTTTISFTNDNGEIVVDVDRIATVVDPVDANDFKNKTIFPIFRDNRARRPKRNNISKENKQITSTNLDSMIDKFNKDCKDNQKSAYNNNKNKGKRKRK